MEESLRQEKIKFDRENMILSKSDENEYRYFNSPESYYISLPPEGPYISLPPEGPVKYDVEYTSNDIESFRLTKEEVEGYVKYKEEVLKVLTTLSQKYSTWSSLKNYKDTVLSLVDETRKDILSVSDPGSFKDGVLDKYIYVTSEEAQYIENYIHLKHEDIYWKRTWREIPTHGNTLNEKASLYSLTVRLDGILEKEEEIGVERETIEKPKTGFFERFSKLFNAETLTEDRKLRM
jgi:hypothetical protein